MTMWGRNDRNAFAALSAEEELRRINEEATREPHPAAEDLAWARPDGERQPSRARKIFRRIGRALGR